jgi:hypothetical protein
MRRRERSTFTRSFHLDLVAAVAGHRWPRLEPDRFVNGELKRSWTVRDVNVAVAIG